MRIYTRTSQYSLAQTKDGKFVLTKTRLYKGKTSLVKVGRSFVGDTIVITRNGLEINTPEGMKTSPLKLPIVDICEVDGNYFVVSGEDNGMHINVRGSPYTTLPAGQKTALD